ncbi:MAG: hypothetical protein IJ301_02510 [Clostridia bacterium]|nr:hypothetical protein [Clostridia bacterium]
MTTLGILMTIAFCLLSAGILAVLILYMRVLYQTTKQSTADKFIIKAPIWHIWASFLGYFISFFVIVAISTFWASASKLEIYLIFALFAVIFLIEIFAHMRTCIIIDGENITRITLLRKKTFKKSEITTQKPINDCTSIVFYKGDSRAFIVSDTSIGYEYLLEYTSDIPQYNFTPPPMPSLIKHRDESEYETN